MEVFVAMDVLAVQPDVRRSVRGQDAGHCLRGGIDHLRVGPGPQVVAGVVERGEIDEVIVEAADVPPGQAGVAHCEGIALHGSLGVGGWRLEVGRCARSFVP